MEINSCLRLAEVGYSQKQNSSFDKRIFMAKTTGCFTQCNTKTVGIVYNCLETIRLSVLTSLFNYAKFIRLEVRGL